MKRLLSILLSLALCVSAVPTSFAAGHSAFPINQSAEIEAERERLIGLLKQQLVAQDALDYLDQFIYLVEDSINQTYYPDSYRQSRSLHYAPSGGYVTGSSSYYERFAEYFNTAQTLKIYQDRNSNEDEVKSILQDIGTTFLEFTGLDHVISIIPFCDTIAKNNMWNSVDVGYEGHVLNSVYDKLEDKTIQVLWGWSDEAYIDTSIFPSDEGLEVGYH